MCFRRQDSCPIETGIYCFNCPKHRCDMCFPLFIIIFKKVLMKSSLALFALVCATVICNELRSEPIRPMGRSLEETSLPFTCALFSHSLMYSLRYLEHWMHFWGRQVLQYCYPT